MAKRHVPTEQDRLDAIRVALSGIAAGRDVDGIVRELAVLQPANDTFPGEVLLELAADAIELSGVSRAEPLDYSGIRERFLPEVEFRGRYERHKSHYALRAAGLIAAGIDPAVLDEVAHWQHLDPHVWAFYALVIFVRVAAERTGRSAAEVCTALAERHDVTLPA